MTDEAYKAKTWLNRTIDLYQQAEKTENALKLIESRLNSAVANYENTGSGSSDLVVRQQRHEDLLLDYSMKKEQYEREYMRFVRQNLITMNVLDRMENRLHSSILFARFINRYSFKEIEKKNFFNLKRSQLYNHYNEALNELGLLLTTEEPKAIQKAEETIKKHLNQATA